MNKTNVSNSNSLLFLIFPLIFLGINGLFYTLVATFLLITSLISNVVVIFGNLFLNTYNFSPGIFEYILWLLLLYLGLSILTCCALQIKDRTKYRFIVAIFSIAYLLPTLFLARLISPTFWIAPNRYSFYLLGGIFSLISIFLDYAFVPARLLPESQIFRKFRLFDKVANILRNKVVLLIYLGSSIIGISLLTLLFIWGGPP